ncbi:MAG: MarR family winged helix-turn-helix transcriptional regulator [Methanobacterium sp.]
MEFEELFIKISEIIHQHIAANKEKALNKYELSDITMNQLYYLEAIYKLDNPTFSELANELKVNKASVTGAMNKLTKLEYVYKVQSDKDQRIFNIHLSEKGKIAIEIDKKIHEEFSKYIKTCLDENEIEELTKIFKKMIECQYSV